MENSSRGPFNLKRSHVKLYIDLEQEKVPGELTVEAQPGGERGSKQTPSSVKTRISKDKQES